MFAQQINNNAILFTRTLYPSSLKDQANHLSAFLLPLFLSLPLACLWHIFMRKSHRLCVHAFGRKVSKMTLFPANDACSTQPEMTTVCAVLRYSTFLKVIVKTYAYWSKITETVRILRQCLHSLQRHNIRILLQHFIVTSILRRRDWLLSDFASPSVTATVKQKSKARAGSHWRQMSGATWSALNTVIITCSEACGGSMDHGRIFRRRREKRLTFYKWCYSEAGWHIQGAGKERWLRTLVCKSEVI